MNPGTSWNSGLRRSEESSDRRTSGSNRELYLSDADSGVFDNYGADPQLSIPSRGRSRERYSEGISRMQSRMYNMAQIINEPRLRRRAFKKFARSDAPLSLAVADDLIAVSDQGEGIVALPIGPVSGHGPAPHMEESPSRTMSRTSASRMSIDSEQQQIHKQNVALDTIVENQRGWFFFGFPYFSDKSLLPWDPSHWSSDTGTPLNGGPREYSVPDETWDWVWHSWYTDMSGDVDDQGWRYAWRFGSSTWHGSHTWFRSFARRRIWRRLRRKAPSSSVRLQMPERVSLDSRRSSHVDLTNTLSTTTTTTNKALPRPVGPLPTLKIAEEAESDQDMVDELVNQMQASRIDRERIQLFITFVNKHSENATMLSILMRQLAKPVATLHFPESKTFLRNKLEPMATNPYIANILATLDA